MKENLRVEALVWSTLLKAYNFGLKSAFQDKFSKVVWVSPNKNRCEICQSLDGIELSLEKAEELFPAHPYCGCFVIPKITIKKSFTNEETLEIAEKLNINWKVSKFTPEEFRKGLDIELEHGLIAPETNITNDDPILTAKITLAHLNEIKDYNTRLLEMEKGGKHGH